MRSIEIQILRTLARSERSLWELLNTSHYLLADLIKALNNLYSGGLIGTDGHKIFVTEKGKAKVSSENLEFTSELCRRCDGRTIEVTGKFNELLEDYRRIVKDRPRPTLDYFQGYMKEHDVIARVALMNYYGDLAGQDFILIGDDDLLSVALSLTEAVNRVVVLDIDARIGEFIGRVNEDYGFSIEFIRYNVADPLPKYLIGKFDVFSSEPLETFSGLRAFVVRGVSCLKDNGVGYFGLTTAEASLKKWISIERMLTRMGCVITDIIRNFSHYDMKYETINYESFVQKLMFPVDENPGIAWYKSALFRFEVLEKPKPSVDPERRIRVRSFDPDEDVTYPGT